MSLSRPVSGYAGLFALLALAGCGQGETVINAPTPGVDVRAYDVRIRLDPVSLYLSARARLTVFHTAEANTLDLQLGEAMRIRRILVNEDSVGFERQGDRLRIPLPEGDSVRVDIIYYGRVDEGLHRGDAGGQTVTFSQAWPQHGSGWLPGVHHPSDPARFNLHLIVPKDYDVVASGVYVSARIRPDNTWKRYNFSLDADAPAYTFAFAIADSFVVVEDSTDSGLAIRHHILPDDARSAARLARTPQVLEALEAILGPYPYAAYSTVEIPMGHAGMENAATSFLSADLYAPSSSGRNTLEEVNIHEAAHQWFGNDVVPADWRDLWLAEGFATYLTTVVYEQMDGPEVAQEHRARMAQLGRRDARRRLVPEQYDDPENLLSATVYQKGGCVLHLLRLTLGDDVFFAALRRLVRDYAGRPLSTEALRMLLEEESGRDLDDFFAYWVYGTRIPELRTSWDRSAQRLTWRIEGDAGTLDGVPVELLIQQDGYTEVVNALDEEAVLPGADKPRVLPIGVLMDVRD